MKNVKSGSKYCNLISFFTDIRIFFLRRTVIVTLPQVTLHGPGGNVAVPPPDPLPRPRNLLQDAAEAAAGELLLNVLQVGLVVIIEDLELTRETAGHNTALTLTVT